MFKKYLREISNNIAIIGKDGVPITGKQILVRAKTYSDLFQSLDIDSKDLVAILTDDPLVGTASIIACLSYGINFTILDNTEPKSDSLAKLAVAEPSSSKRLLLSEEALENPNEGNTLTINPKTLNVIVKGINYKMGNISTIRTYDKIFNELKDLINTEKLWENKETIPIKNEFITPKKIEYYGIIFHNGISKGVFNASKISHHSIYRGLRTVIEDDSHKIKDTFITFEPFNSLYDITNGIIIPMLKGAKVIIGDPLDYYTILKSMENKNVDQMYINAEKLEYILTALEREVTPLLRFWKPLRHLLVLKEFKKRFGLKLKEIFINGKIKRRGILNAIKVKYTVLYTMTEVATYVGKKSYFYLPKNIGIIPKIEDKITISEDTESEIGEVFIECVDMADGYLTSDHTRKNFLLNENYVGKLRTGDIGYAKNGALYLLGKNISMYLTSEGKTVQTQKILDIAYREPLVKSATIIVGTNKNGEPELILIVEPDFSYGESKELSPTEVMMELKTLKGRINKYVDNYSKLGNVYPYTNPDGIIRKNYKKVDSRYF